MSAEAFRDCFFESFSILKNKPAVTFLREGKVETSISYFELDRDTDRMSSTFLSLGVETGDRVILFLQKSLIFVVAHLALQKIGAISVPLNPGFKRFEMEYLIQDAEPKAILCEPRKESFIREINPNLKNIVVDTQKPYQELDIFRNTPANSTTAKIRLEDPGLIIYTSGTTGKPKGAVLTQRNLLHDALTVINVWEISQTDVFCHALPLFHVHGLCFALHTALIAGSHVLMIDQFVPSRVVEALGKQGEPHQCTVFMAVPAMYGKLMEYLGDKKLDFGHMRLWTSGSAPLLSKDFDRIHKIFGKEPVEREGMSETGMNFSNPLRGKKKPGSIGLPLPSLDVRIIDPESGADLRPGQTGEIWLRGPSVFPGYWRKDNETARAFEQGWFKTGDLGKIDEEGYYYLTDRIKDIIISGGENISPGEIEEVINRLGDVLESSVLGVYDEKWGEKVVAAVVKKTGAKLKEDRIQDFCRKHLHDWKCPKEIAFVKKLPRNTMGKVLKEEIKKFF